MVVICQSARCEEFLSVAFQLTGAGQLAGVPDSVQVFIRWRTAARDVGRSQSCVRINDETGVTRLRTYGEPGPSIVWVDPVQPHPPDVSDRAMSLTGKRHRHEKPRIRWH